MSSFQDDFQEQDVPDDLDAATGAAGAAADKGDENQHDRQKTGPLVKRRCREAGRGQKAHDLE